ncbi:MAG: phosphoribosyltransferase family protein [Bacteroidota bacterium]
MTKIQILKDQSIQQRLRRMAFEIYESHYQEEELLIMGIDERGGALSQKLSEHLAQISPLNLTLVNAHLDRESDPNGIGIEVPLDLEDLRNKPVLVVDDVLYTGNTMLHVVTIILQAAPSSIRTAVLVDRGHRMVPVSADFTGLELATTFHQHVEFNVSDEGMAAFLH